VAAHLPACGTIADQENGPAVGDMGDNARTSLDPCKQGDDPDKSGKDWKLWESGLLKR